MVPGQNGAGAVTRNKTGNCRLGAGQWPQRHHLGREVPAGCLVCGQLVLVAGHQDHRHDHLEDPQTGRNQSARAGDDAGIHG